MSLLNKVIGLFVGKKSVRDIAEIQPYVDKIKEQEKNISVLTNNELRAKTNELKATIKNHISEIEKEIEQLKATIDNTEIHEREDLWLKVDKLEKEKDQKIEEVLDEILPVAFAIVKETAKRFFENEKLEVTAQDFDRDLAAKHNHIEIEGDKAYWNKKWLAGGNEISWDMVHYDVQLIGGVALHKGNIAEMATGEGKTLVATLPIFLNALAQKGVHIVTVNDYLSKRDSEWMGPLFQFHGLTIDCIDKHQPNSEGRRKAYAADITYGTNNEFGFDYLRDNMAISTEDLVQRKHHYAIVDEVDSVLIDDARTPLIISGPIPKGDIQLYDEFKPKIELLYKAQRNLVTQLLADAKRLIQQGTNEKGGFHLVQAYKGLPKNNAFVKFTSEQGMKALLHKTENIYMQDNNKRMHEVTDDLYFVIDEKNNSIELTDKGIDLITSKTDDSRFFILPDIGSEIADIEKSNLPEKDKLVRKDELLRDYAIKSERVHTVNQLLKAYSLFEIDVEYVVMDNKVKIVDEQTGRILDGRRYSDGLHQAIEAKENVRVEAATQTFATITLQNYFRMYHKLAGMTGTAETEAGEFWDIYKLDVVVIPTNRNIVRKDIQDLVYKTKREKYNAVIDEISSLVNDGRPVLVGTTSVEISELLSRMLKIRSIRHNVLNAKLHQKEADIVAEAGQSKTVTIATNMAGRGTDIKLSQSVKEAGGLAIVGTERHESRRVDRQLRGRAGRQGDPGSSQFFVSLEDDLMRLFGSDRIARMMDRLGHKEGDMIQHSMITKSIERAQKKVEENNFGIRKRLLEYDDVMNSQREVIYKRRKHALYGERLGLDIANMLSDVTESIITAHHGNSDYSEFKLDLIRVMSIDTPFSEKDYLGMSPDELYDILYKVVIETYKRKMDVIAQQAYPVIKDVFEHQSHVYENIIVPITDGVKVYNIITNLKLSYETTGKEVVSAYQKSAILWTIDEYWKEHLREMDDLKQSVHNAVYEQKDPLLIYKFESFQLFKTMINNVNRDITSILMKGHIPIQDSSQVQEAKTPRKLDLSKMETSRNETMATNSDAQNQRTQPVKVEKKVGRNEPCPCGSGKKYKNCHGKEEFAS
ncbi:MAG TPA: preprotein translocase subunit SecA [Bacteroidales bacterium]|nr:MAG: preprotein translocase subunit SecA [Bacteroidetes bacterium GWF2_35_48]HBX52143.1 preprotein translocase subunit SecA [Bacteroidales bacterium]